jgi:hypothetical protein
MPRTSTQIRFSLVDLLKQQMKTLKDMSFLSEDAKQTIGETIVKRIVERTRYGVGVENPNDKGIGEAVRFKPYADSYKPIRQEEGLPTNKVDLTVTGHLLDNLEVKRIAQNGNITIGLDESADLGKARGAHEGVRTKKYGLLKRPFLGLTKTDVSAMWPAIGHIINKEFAKYQKEQRKK